MEQKGSSCPRNVCKKICRAFSTSSPAFRRIRRVSHPPNPPAVAAKTPTSKEAESVPISFDYSSQMIKKNTHLAKTGDAISHDENSGVHIEDRFTEFINRARIKIGTNSTTCDPGRKIASVKDHKSSEICSMKDRFSDYIDRTKKKLRTTSAVGVENSISFK